MDISVILVGGIVSDISISIASHFLTYVSALLLSSCIALGTPILRNSSFSSHRLSMDRNLCFILVIFVSFGNTFLSIFI